jgi:hypothetical protein
MLKAEDSVCNSYKCESQYMIAGNFRQLQNDEKTKILPNGTLIVNAVNHEDEGWYTCTAKNKGK